MIHAVVSSTIRASRSAVFGLYVDYEAWPLLFPRTIRGTRLVRDDGNVKVIEVDHISGVVRNVMTIVSPEEVRLAEWKRHHDARFVSRFEPIPQGTLYTLIGDITPKGPLRALEPLAAPYVRYQLRRFVLSPVASAAEATRRGDRCAVSGQISWGIGRRGARKYRSGEYGPKFDTRDV